MCAYIFFTVRLFAVRLFAVPTYLSKASAIVKSSCAAFRQNQVKPSVPLREDGSKNNTQISVSQYLSKKKGGSI